MWRSKPVSLATSRKSASEEFTVPLHPAMANSSQAWPIARFCTACVLRTFFSSPPSPPQFLNGWKEKKKIKRIIFHSIRKCCEISTSGSIIKIYCTSPAPLFTYCPQLLSNYRDKVDGVRETETS